MTTQIIVLVTEGKDDSVDYAKVVLFTDRKLAEMFVNRNNTGKIKHWKKAEIVEDGERIELYQPDSEDEYFN